MGERRPIRVLPDDLANQIAAGEVVERPASVVKELCENAIDAGATRVRIEIEGGGIALVRVTDDGSGMDEADLRASVLRHATSKIAELGDLSSIGSFGFRGEALPSIASVSRFRIETRRAGDAGGHRLEIEGGGPARVAPCGAPPGTCVEIRDLFFNVPARRKFLRALATESAHVTEVAEALALGNPGLSVVLERDGRKVREHLRASSREERVRDVLPGWELLPCRGQRGPLRVEAFLSRPEKARLGAGSLWIFVNGRPVRDRALARSVAHAYGSVLEPGRYPVGAVYLELPLELVDVNVHPQKAEVRFAEPRAVLDALHRVVEAELGAALTGQTGLGVAPLRGALPPTWSGERKARPAEELPDGAGAWTGSGALPPEALTLGALPASSAPRLGAPALPYPVVAGPPPLATDEAQDLPGALEFVAQVRRTFLVCESADALVILDQHAAAERVTFDRLKRALEQRSIAMQTLLVPELVDVGASAVALVEELGEAILSMGMDVRAAGSTSVAIHAVPQLLAARASPARLLSALLPELSKGGGRGYSGAIDLALATMACHGSIRAGDAVSAEEARELLTRLAAVSFGGHCPHGRPIVTRISFRELESRVGRR